MKRLALFICLLCLVPQWAAAETRSMGYSVWNVIGRGVYVRYMMTDRDAASLAAVAHPANREVADRVLAHLAATRGGKACEAIDQGQDVGQINILSLAPGLLRFEIIFQCPAAGDLVLSDTVFPGADHIDFAHIQNGGRVLDTAFTAQAPHIDLNTVRSGPVNQATLQSAELGLTHIYRDAGIVCLIVAMILLMQAGRDIFAIGGGLAGGYVAAILLTAFNLIAPRFGSSLLFNGYFVFLTAGGVAALGHRSPRHGGWALAAVAAPIAVSAFILKDAREGFAILWIGLLAAAVLFIPSPNRARVLLLSAICFLFALLDGLILTRNFAIFAVPASQTLPMALTFNIAALLGAIILPLAALAISSPERLRSYAIWQYGPGRDLAASLLIGCGIFWLVTQLSA